MKDVGSKKRELRRERALFCLRNGNEDEEVYILTLDVIMALCWPTSLECKVNGGVGEEAYRAWYNFLRRGVCKLLWI